MSVGGWGSKSLALMLSSALGAAGLESRAATVPGVSDAAVPPGPEAAAPEVLTLEHAISLAMGGNRNVLNAALEVSKAEDELGSFRTNALPSFNLYALETETLTDIKVRVPEGAFGTFAGTGPIPAADTQVTTPTGRKALILGQVAQPLTQLRRVSLGVGVKRSNLEVARQQLRSQRQSVVNDVRRAYYALLRTQSALEAAEEAVRFLRELDRVVAARVEQKVELPSSGLEVSARLAKAEYDALSLRNDRESGRERLNDFLGRAIDVPFDVSPVPEVAAYETDLQAARALALSHRPDLEQARQRRRQAELDHRIKKWDFVPDISLTYTYLGLPDVDLLPRSISSAGLLLSWEPFDWGRRRRAMAESRRTVEQSENAIKEAESLVAIDVGVRLREVQEARALIDATSLGRDAARSKLKVTTEKYHQKAALLKDVLQDQDNLAAADRQQEEALLSAWTARADLEKALGED